MNERELHRLISESVKRVLNEDISVIDDVYKILYSVHYEVRNLQHQLQREASEAYQALEHLEAEVLKTAQVIGTMRPLPHFKPHCREQTPYLALQNIWLNHFDSAIFRVFQRYTSKPKDFQ